MSRVYEKRRIVNVIIHGGVRFAARPSSDKAMVWVGIQPIAAGNYEWLDAVTVAAVGREW